MASNGTQALDLSKPLKDDDPELYEIVQKEKVEYTELCCMLILLIFIA